MKIVVPVKAVAELDDEFELGDDGTVGPDDLDWSLNEWDDYSVDVATGLCEAGGGGEVVAVGVGGEAATESLTSAIARGADRAVRIPGDGLPAHDPIAVARVLAAFVERESPDLVLCGVQSSDAAHSATGVALAGIAGLHRVAVVSAIDLDADARKLIVDRELEAGLVERLSLSLPALLTVQTGITEPGYVSFRAIKNAEKQGVEELLTADLGIEAASGAFELRRLAAPPAGDGAEMLSEDSAEAAVRIAELVRLRIGA